MLRPRTPSETQHRPITPLQRTPTNVRGHVTREGAVVDPYESHRNTRVPITPVVRYKKFEQLAEGEGPGAYEIHSDIRPDAKYGIIGIHGGKISKVVSYLTEKLSGSDFSKYTFEGKKASGNGNLVLQGSKFNEPRAIEVAQSVPVAISLAISDRKDKVVLIDGRNEALSDDLTLSLKSKGFIARKPFDSHRNGRRRTNIANLGSTGMGVQIQLPKGLRMQMTQELDEGRAAQPNSLLTKFTQAVRGVLDRTDPADSVVRTKAQIRSSGRERTSHNYIGEFSDLTPDKKLDIATSLTQTNELHGMQPESLARRLNKSTVFVAFDKDNNTLTSAAGLKPMKGRMRDRIIDTYEGTSSDPNAELLVPPREMNAFIGNVERGHAVEYGWAFNRGPDKTPFKKVLNLLFTDAAKKGYGANAIFSVVRSDNANGLRHSQSLGMVPAMKFSSPFSDNKLILFVYRGRRS